MSYYLFDTEPQHKKNVASAQACISYWFPENDTYNSSSFEGMLKHFPILQGVQWQTQGGACTPLFLGPPFFIRTNTEKVRLNIIDIFREGKIGLAEVQKLLAIKDPKLFHFYFLSILLF